MMELGILNTAHAPQVHISARRIPRASHHESATAKWWAGREVMVLRATKKPDFCASIGTVLAIDGLRQRGLVSSGLGGLWPPLEAAP